MKRVEIYTDGACKGNPGPGGYGAILVYGGQERVLSGGEPSTTNNRMELTAAIAALERLREPCEVTLTERFALSGGRRHQGLGAELAAQRLEKGRQKPCAQQRPLGASARAAGDAPRHFRLGARP